LERSVAWAAKAAALECIDEESALDQCESYGFLHELLGDMQTACAELMADARTHLAARNFERLSFCGDGVAGAANNLHLRALSMLGYALCRLASCADKSGWFWCEDHAHLRSMAVALTAEQRARLKERLALAVPPLITLIEQQLARVQAYMPRVARLADEELEWQQAEETCGILPPVTNVENPPAEFQPATVSASDH
jgi:hypothetical protein